MKFNHLLTAIGLIAALVTSSPAVAQFDQLNKALGEISKQAGKEKGKKPPSEPTNAAPAATPTSQAAQPPQQTSTTDSGNAKFCGRKGNTECFTGEKIDYRGKWDIMGIRLGKVDIADLNRQISERRCTTDFAPVGGNTWKQMGQLGGFAPDTSMNLGRLREYTVTCETNDSTKYMHAFWGDPYFPEYFISASHIVRMDNTPGTKNGGIQTFTREISLIKTLIAKFGEPKQFTPSGVFWEGEHGEGASVLIKTGPHDIRYIDITIVNAKFMGSFTKDVHQRMSEAHKRHQANQSVPKL